MYQVGKRHEYKVKVYQMPDNMHITMIQDLQKKVDLTTFLDDSSILLKIGKRYMHFSQDGKFIEEINFKEDEDVEKTRKTNVLDSFAKSLQSRTNKFKKVKKNKVKMVKTTKDDQSDNANYLAAPHL